jgi:hypothetical protein
MGLVEFIPDSLSNSSQRKFQLSPGREDYYEDTQSDFAESTVSLTKER